MPKPPWQIATNLALLTAAAVVCIVAAGLIVASFGDSLGRITSNKGEVPEWVANQGMIEEYADGIHLPTGLAAGRGLAEVRANCTNCHSAKLITQNRMTRDGWRQTIIWMQQTQGLWELGASQGIILDYLSEHYAPEDLGRRAQLKLEEDDWYHLQLD